MGIRAALPGYSKGRHRHRHSANSNDDRVLTGYLVVDRMYCRAVVGNDGMAAVVDCGYWTAARCTVDSSMWGVWSNLAGCSGLRYTHSPWEAGKAPSVVDSEHLKGQQRIPATCVFDLLNLGIVKHSTRLHERCDISRYLDAERRRPVVGNNQTDG